MLNLIFLCVDDLWAAGTHEKDYEFCHMIKVCGIIKKFRYILIYELSIFIKKIVKSCETIIYDII